MTHSERCPICLGSGKLLYQNYFNESSCSNTSEHTCHGCTGKGWIEVNDSYPVFSIIPKCTCGTNTTAPCPIHNINVPY